MKYRCLFVVLIFASSAWTQTAGAEVDAQASGGEARPSVPGAVRNEGAPDEGDCRQRPEQCASILKALWANMGPRDDRRPLIPRFAAACEGGSGYACDLLAGLYSSGSLIERDLKRAAALHDRACVDLKWPMGCHRAGNFSATVHRDRGVQQDLSKAAMYYAKGCDMGVAESCEQLARQYRSGEGVKANRSKVRQLKARAESLRAADKD